MADILIVEDERIVARDLGEMLHGLGHAVVATAASFEEALYAAKQYSPNLAIIDIRLAGDRDGISFALELREELDISIAFLSSHADPHTVGRAAAVKPNGYLVKPFTAQQIDALVQTSLANYSKGQRQLDHRRLADGFGNPAHLSIDQLDAVERFVEQHLDQKVCLNDLADLCEMSPSVFCRRFKATRGVTPYQYVVDQRLAEGKRLLRNTNWTIAEVSLASGFANQAHFTYTFGRAFGISPSVYRKSV